MKSSSKIVTYSNKILSSVQQKKHVKLKFYKN
jgi:hypothetical protein